MEINNSTEKHGILRVSMRINPGKLKHLTLTELHVPHLISYPSHSPRACKHPHSWSHFHCFSYAPVFSYHSIKYPSVCANLDMELEFSTPQGPVTMSDLRKKTYPLKELKGFVCLYLKHSGNMCRMNSEHARQKCKNKKKSLTLNST